MRGGHMGRSPHVVRGRARPAGAVCALVLGVGLLAACAPAPPPPPPPPTRGSTFAYQPPPPAFTEVAPPAGASSSPGASHWYRAPTGDGHAVELGVYLPVTSATTPPRTVLVLHGGDGLRRRYEDLARGYALQGDIGVVGCWFDQPEALLGDDAVSCSGGPTFKGTETGAVADVNTIIAALAQVPIAPLVAAPATIDVTKLAIVGHSYGSGVALMRAADGGHTEPIVSSSGFYAPNPALSTRPGDRFPIDFVSSITGPVQILHGATDNITLLTDAMAFRDALTAALHPPTYEVFPAPADHTFPWESGPDVDFPGTTFASRFLVASGTWIDLQLP
jgi:dienelactone hydrolase